MDKKLEKQLKKQLESEQAKLTKELKKFANKDSGSKGNWLTRIPFLGMNRSHPDEAAEKIEAYENLLPIEHAKEKRLQDINEALEKINKGTYGKCENCQGKIEEKRLKIVPEARTCLKCSK